MSDVHGIDISDILGLSQPLTKLVETVSCGIGKIYDPVHVKRMAKAKAQEIEVISGAVSEQLSLPIRYEDGAISIDTQDANDLVTRAQKRFLFQEMIKQQNIDSVVAAAYNELKEETHVSEEKVDRDWISQFFDSVANVSNEEMQTLWAKLLAGEVKHPGSFSLRTLEVLKRLTQKEAEIFKEIAPFLLWCKGDQEGTVMDCFLLPAVNQRLLEQYDIHFVKIMRLGEAGLMSENSQIYIGFSVHEGQSELIRGLNRSIRIENRMSEPIDVSHAAYFLTEVGKELLPIVLTNGCQETVDAYLNDCLNEIKMNGITIKGLPMSVAESPIGFEIIENK